MILMAADYIFDATFDQVPCSYDGLVKSDSVVGLEKNIWNLKRIFCGLLFCTIWAGLAKKIWHWPDAAFKKLKTIGFPFNQTLLSPERHSVLSFCCQAVAEKSQFVFSKAWL